MQTVEQRYRALIPQLLALYPHLLSRPIKDSHHEVGHVAHGWYMRCHRGVEAVLQLEQTGYQEEAGPIRRSIVEHVVALKWLAAEGNAMSTALRRGATHEATKRKAALQTANWTSVDLTPFDNVIADGVNLDRQQDHLLNFKQRCDAYGTPHDLATYLNEVARFHPSWESAVPYFTTDNGNVTALSRPAWSIDQAGFCAIHLLEALDAFHFTLREAPFKQEIDKLHDDLKAIVVSQRREFGLSIPPELDDERTADVS
jgi:hypothetical protein